MADISTLTEFLEVDFSIRWGLVEVWDTSSSPNILTRSWRITAAEVHAVNSSTKFAPPGATAAELRDYFVAVNGKVLLPGQCCIGAGGELFLSNGKLNSKNLAIDLDDLRIIPAGKFFIGTDKKAVLDTTEAANLKAEYMKKVTA